jgi:hypothetical protein
MFVCFCPAPFKYLQSHEIKRRCLSVSARRSAQILQNQIASNICLSASVQSLLNISNFMEKNNMSVRLCRVLLKFYQRSKTEVRCLSASARLLRIPTSKSVCLSELSLSVLDIPLKIFQKATQEGRCLFASAEDLKYSKYS